MMTMDVKRLFLDTNVLIYATSTSSPWKSLAKNVLDRALKHNIQLVLSPQVLREYFAITTRASVINKAIQLNDIIDNLNTFQTLFTVLGEPPEIVE